MIINWDFRTKLTKIALTAVSVLFVTSMCAMVAYAGNKAVIITEESAEVGDDFELSRQSFSKTIDLASIHRTEGSDVVIFCPSMPTSENVMLVQRYSDSKLLLVWKEGRDEYFINNPLKGSLEHVKKLKLSGDGSNVYFTFELDGMYECRVNFDNRDLKLDFIPVDKEETVVAIDPGHGGNANGVSVGDLAEKDVVLAVSERVKKLAKDKPYRIILLRDGDYSMSQADRIKECEALGADYYISLHASADTDDERIYGMSAEYNGTFYRDGLSNVSFADTILKSVCESAKNRGIALDSKPEDEMLKSLKIPAVNLYIGYLSNKEEGELLVRGDYCDRIASGILKGLDEVID